MERPKKKTVTTVPPVEVEESRLRNDQYETLMASVRSVQNDLAGIDRDLEHDRRDLQDFKIRLGTLEGEIKQLREAVNLNADRVKDKVTDAVEPMEKEVIELKEAVNKKRVLSFKRKDTIISNFIKRVNPFLKKKK